MVERRDSERPVRLSQTPQVARGQVPQATPGQAGGAFGTHVASAPHIIRGEHQDRAGSVLVQHLLKAAGGMLDAVVDDRRQQAYLDGALAAGAGIAEEDLQNNLLTRTWSIAGHRDYSGRMAALEYETRLASELSTDREMSPEEYAAKLSERRKAILPIIEGMSRDARGRMLDQLLTTEMAAQQNHLKARAEYIAEMEMRLLTAETNVGIDRLNASRGSGDTYEAELAAVFTKLVRNVVDNPQFTNKDKSDFITSTVEYALAQGDFGLYHLIENEGVIPHGDELLPVSSILNVDDRTKLRKAYTTSSRQYGMQRFSDLENRIMMAEVTLETGGSIPLNEYEGILRDLDTMSKYGLIEPSRHRSIVKSLTKGMTTQLANSESFEAWVRGDTGALAASGSTDATQAKEFWARVNAQAETPTQAFEAGMSMYRRNGSKKLGELLAESAGNSLEQWYRSDDTEAEMPAELRDKLGLIMALKARGDAGDTVLSKDFADIINAIPSDDARSFMWAVTALTQKGMDVDTAATKARTDILIHSRRPEDEKRGIREANIARIRESYEVLRTNSHWWETEFIPGLFGDIDTLTVRQRQVMSVFGGGYKQTLQELFYHNLSSSINERMSAVANYPGEWTASDIQNMVTAEIQSAGVLTDFGTLTADVGLNINEALGIPPVYPGMELAGELLEKVIQQEFDKETRGNIVAISHITRGRGGEYVLQITPMNTNTGGLLQPFEIPQDELRRYAKQHVDSEEARALSRVEGAAIEGKSGDAIAFRTANIDLNGLGLTHFRAVQLAQHLADLEDVTLKHYDDAGRISIGVGLNSGNDGFMKVWGEITGSESLKDSDKLPEHLVRKAIERGFEAVFEAMYKELLPSINRVKNSPKYQYPNWAQGDSETTEIEKFLLSVYWQTGHPQWYSKSNPYQGMVEALRDRNIPEARRLLESSLAWERADKSRKEYYTSVLDKLQR